MEEPASAKGVTTSGGPMITQGRLDRSVYFSLGPIGVLEVSPRRISKQRGSVFSGDPLCHRGLGGTADSQVSTQPLAQNELGSIDSSGLHASGCTQPQRLLFWGGGVVTAHCR